MNALDVELDPLLSGAAAIDLARAAILEVAPPEQVGEHLAARSDAVAGPAMASHFFACTSPAYVGWQWSATLVAVPGADAPTVSEVVLLPGDGALRSPEWLPWNQRVRPGDLGPGDLHPTTPDDPRLEPGYTGSDALEEADDPASPYGVLRPAQWELGLGRERVLSVLGRDLAVERWHDGDHGPHSAMAKAAPAPCSTCGFLLPIGGSVGQAFGLCANPFGADGSVVALGYGCGAHSSVREIEGTGIPVTDVVVDEYGFVEVHAREAVDEGDQLVTSQVVIAEDAADFAGAANASESGLVDDESDDDGDADSDADQVEGDADRAGTISDEQGHDGNEEEDAVGDIDDEVGAEIDDDEPELDEGGEFATGALDDVIDIDPDDL